MRLAPITFLAPSGFRTPIDSHAYQTPWSVFQDGSDGEPTGRCPRRDRALRGTLGKSVLTSPAVPAAKSVGGVPPSGRRPPAQPQRSAPRAERRTGPSPFCIRPGCIAGPHPLPSRQFQALFDPLFKVLFIFPSRYLFTIGLSPVFSLGRNLPPDWG